MKLFRFAIWPIMFAIAIWMWLGRKVDEMLFIPTVK